MANTRSNLGWALSIVLLIAQPSYQSVISGRQSGGLQWGPCIQDLPADDGVVCANFTVPLDWTNPSNGRSAYLYVAKLPARNGSPLGTIFTNPGGPGGSGTGFIARGAELLSNITGGMFDIVSWDPRGVGHTIPAITHLDDGQGLTLQDIFAFSENLLQSTLNSNSMEPSQADIDAFLANATNVETYFNSFVQTVVSKSQDNLKYVGTVATTRDLVALADAIEGPKSLIRYWGFSYGTLLGSYLLDLFPDRVGGVVLDGVVDATIYSQSPSYKVYADDIQDADMALQAFYDACAAAGPPLCPIAVPGATGARVKQWALELLDDAYAAVKANTPTGGVTANIVRYRLANAARSPDLWQLLAESLSLMYQDIHNGGNSSARSVTQLQRFTNHLAHPKRQAHANPMLTTQASPYAIWCGDAIDNTDATTAIVFQELVRTTKQVSNIHGPIAIEFPSTFCHLWPVRAVERHPNQGSPKLANPVLVIGNTYDSITPLASAVKLVTRLNAAGSRQAVLVQHDGTGHLATGMDSACTYDIIKRYFSEGVIPGDTLCGTNFNGFSGGIQATNRSTSTSIISAPLALASGPVGSGIPVIRTIPVFHIFAWSALAMLLGSISIL